MTVTTEARKSGSSKRAIDGKPVGKMPTSWRRYLVVAMSLIALYLISEFSASSLGNRNDLNLFLIYALLALGFYWIYGLSGQFSFAHAAFSAIGAYSSAWLSREGWSIPFSIAGALAITMACAIIFLVVVRRASHFYFAIASLGMASVVLFILQKWNGFTGGADGQVNQIALLSRDGFPLSASEVTQILLVVLVVGYLIAILLDLAPIRRDAIALKYLPEVARVCGVRDLATRLSLFALGSAAAALAGALLAHSNGFLGPESFGTHLAIGIFLMMVVGGEGYLVGPLMGAAFYIFFPRLLTEVGLAAYEQLLYGSTLVALMIFMPNGILGGLDRLRLLLSDAARGTIGSFGSRAAGAPSRPAVVRTDETDWSPKVDEGSTRLKATDIHVNFGGVRAVDGISLGLHRGEILGLIGPNGSGKSTLLNALNGLVPATGSLLIDGQKSRLGVPGWNRRLGVMRSFQTPQIYTELNCLENVSLADADRRSTSMLSAILVPWLVRRRERGRIERARAALTDLGFAHLEHAPVGSLSYGERRWIELSRCFVADAGIVLLDEPSAGLNDEETRRLAAVIRTLRERGASIILVDHKVDFITQVTDRIVVLDFGRLIAHGSPVEVFADPLVIEAYTGAPANSTDRYPLEPQMEGTP